ncbi:hypothetical protein RCL1_005914 [Eukaryota sp. TZLM3-RCL]
MQSASINCKVLLYKFPSFTFVMNRMKPFKIRKKVHHWLSHISEDEFLQTRQDPEGYVPLEVFCKFPSFLERVSYEDLVNAVSGSDLFILRNDNMIRLRRVNEPIDKPLPISARQTAGWETILLFSPDGTPLARISKKKCDFYLARNIARIVRIRGTLETAAIQLLIKPLGCDSLSDHQPYLMGPIGEHCVTCGAENNVTMHHIIPRVYRSHFPVGLRSNQSFDVVILCCLCHETYEEFAIQEKQAIAAEYQCPIDGTESAGFQYILKVRNAAIALIKCAHELPYERKLHLNEIVTDFVARFNLEGNLDQILPTLTSLHTLKDIVKLEPHGSCVVRKLVESDIQKEMLHGPQEDNSIDPREVVNLDDFYAMSDLMALETVHWNARFPLSEFPSLAAFIMRWRNHFLTHMQPKYLPQGWTPEAGISCLSV